MLGQEQLNFESTDEEQSKVNFTAEVEVDEDVERVEEDTVEKLYEQL